MANPSFIFQPFTGYTVPVASVYTDQTALATSANSTRQNYVVTADIIIDGNNVDTLRCYPLNNTVQINPQKIAENYLDHTFNYSAVTVADCYESIKPIYTVLGEQFSRAITFSSITQWLYYSYTQLNLDRTIPFISAGDRCLIKKDDSSVNPQYDTYGEVVDASSSAVVLDIPYISATTTESGTLYEGSQMFDFVYSTISGVTGLAVTTYNNHNFKQGDQVFITMDACSTGKFKMVSGSTGSITSVKVNGVELLTSSVAFNTDIPTTMANLSTKINTNISVTGYHSYHLSGSSKLHIYSDRWSGAITNGYPITITTTGNLSIVHSPTMFTAAGYDSATGEGWNQFTGTYTVGLTSPNQFFFTPSTFYNNETGSQRGSIISMNNYVFTGITTGATYYIMNNSNRYDYNDYATEISHHSLNRTGSRYFSGVTPTYLTNQPRNTFGFYSVNDIQTLDFLYKPSSTFLPTRMIIQELTGNTVRNTYTVDMTSVISGYTGQNKYKKMSLGVGAWNLNQINSSLITPSPPAGGMIQPDTTKYIVSLQAYQTFSFFPFSSWIDMIEEVTFNQNCTNNQYYQLIWLNKFGSFDYFTVTTNNEETLNIERTSFERKREGVINNNWYGFNSASRGMVDFTIKSSKSIKLYSNWLTLAQSQWLQEVFESPQVFIYNPLIGTPNDFTALYPVNITNKEVVLPSPKSRLKMFEIDVQISNRRINQKN